jgi:hypothetical protein
MLFVPRKQETRLFINLTWDDASGILFPKKMGTIRVSNPLKFIGAL